MIGEFRIKEAPRAVSLGFAGGVPQDEEKIGRFRIFEHRLQADRFSIDRKFRSAWRGQVSRRAEHGRDIENLGRIVGNPARVHFEVGVGLVPAQSVETCAGRGVKVFDAQRKLAVAIDHDDGDGAKSEFRGMIGIVGKKSLFFRRLAVEQKIFRKTTRRREQTERALFETDRSHMRWRLARDLDATVVGRTKGVVSFFQPPEGD